MNTNISKMDQQLDNLFPCTLKNGASKIFRQPSINPVLLGLLPAGISKDHVQPTIGLAQLLHPEETKIFNGYRLAKRRAEYLTGRICAKIAVQGFLTRTKTHLKALPLPEIEITNARNGRPTVRLGLQSRNTPEMDISISHSGDYGVAIAAGSRCGIDLQLQKATLLQVQEKYCHDTEYRLLETSLPNYGALTRQTILWAAKEAGKKALSHWQMPGFLDLQLRSLKRFPDYLALSLQINNSKSQHLPDEATVVAGLFGKYALAICLIHEEPSNARTP